MIGIMLAYRLFDDDGYDCDEEEPRQETETGPRTRQSYGGDTTQDLSGSSSESHRSVTRQKRRVPKRIVRSVVKKTENCPVPNDVDFLLLVPYLASPPPKEEVESLEALLVSVPQLTDIPGYVMVPMKTDQVTQTDPLLSQMDTSLPMVSEDKCLFHDMVVLQHRTSKKTWEYVQCPNKSVHFGCQLTKHRPWPKPYDVKCTKK